MTPQPVSSTHYAAEVAVIATGTPNQQERYAAGLLPEDELAQLARELFFGAFAEFPRWATSRDRDRLIKALKHDKGCVKSHERDPDDLECEVCEVGEMNADEWAMFKSFLSAASLTNQHAQLDAAACQVHVSQHWVTCKECGAEIARVSAKVTIAWAGRELVREYALDPVRYDEMKRGLR